jgi:hypothetical protein
MKGKFKVVKIEGTTGKPKRNRKNKLYVILGHV